MLIIKKLYLNNFNTNNVTDMSQMLEGCSDELKNKVENLININKRKEQLKMKKRVIIMTSVIIMILMIIMNMKKNH